MARRRSFYARDRRGRFARTTGRGGVYKRKSSTKRKIAKGVAIGGAVAVAYGTQRRAYRRGAYDGWNVGRAAGLYEGKPLRGANGRMLPNSQKRDVSHNPYSKGYRPVGIHNMAQRNPGIRTRVRATRVATYRPEHGRRVISGKKIKR